MPQPTLLLEDLVCERLAICGKNFGLKRTWKTPPKKKIQREDTPCGYTLMGPTYAPIGSSSGKVEVPRTYTFRILIRPFKGGAEDIEDGAASTVEALTWAAVTYGYFQRHLYLNATDPETGEPMDMLRYCLGIEQATDSGYVLRGAPGGGTFAALDVFLNIRMAANAAAMPVAYPTA